MLKDFTQLSYEEAIKILQWRNSPQIAKWMYNKNISKEEHFNFLKKLQNDNTKKYFLVDDIGVIDFTNITKTTANIGLYKNPSKKKVGDKLLEHIIDYGFNNLKLQKLTLEVFKNNQKAISLYKKHNFKTVEEKKDIIKMELSYENRKI